jgi:hypothetical protein
VFGRWPGDHGLVELSGLSGGRVAGLAIAALAVKESLEAFEDHDQPPKSRWVLAIPQYAIVAVFAGGAAYTVVRFLSQSAQSGAWP